MEKIDQTIDEFLDRASQNLTKLEQIHEVSSGKTHPRETLTLEHKEMILDVICRLWQLVGSNRLKERESGWRMRSRKWLPRLHMLLKSGNDEKVAFCCLKCS